MANELTIFGRKHKYTCDIEVQKDIGVMRKLQSEIRKPQTLSYCGLDTVNIYIKEDDNFICNDCIRWIYGSMREKLGIVDIRACLLACSEEDTEWTAHKNEGLTGVFYRKITFYTEIQEKVIQKLAEYIAQAEKIQAEMTKNEKRRKEQIEQLRKEWTVTKTYKKVIPTGGEEGTDGYVDAEYQSEAGETIRMISRDVFDVGCWFYPERLKGTDGAFERKDWTKSEVKLANWLAKFGPFRGVRM